MASSFKPPEGKENRMQKFYEYFTAQMRDHNQELDKAIKDPSAAPGSLDRLMEHVQTLQQDVQDASEYTPDHDQARYAQTIKEFKDRIQTARSAAAPKSKFAFKSGRKITATAPAVSKSASPAVQEQSAVPARPIDSAIHSSSDGESHLDEEDTDLRYDDLGYKHLITDPSVKDVLSYLTHSIVDLRHPTRVALARHPTGLTITHVRGSLLVLGRVQGACHVTDVRNTVIVVETNQLRLHACRDVVVYLSCASRPIIEDCIGMSFAPLPEIYSARAAQLLLTTPEDLRPPPIEQDRWNQVDDFKWLKQTASPNFKILGEEERIAEQVWEKIVPGDEHVGLTDILKAVGIKGAALRRDRRGSEACGEGL